MDMARAVEVGVVEPKRCFRNKVMEVGASSRACRCCVRVARGWRLMVENAAPCRREREVIVGFRKATLLVTMVFLVGIVVEADDTTGRINIINTIVPTLTAARSSRKFLELKSIKLGMPRTCQELTNLYR